MNYSSKIEETVSTINEYLEKREALQRSLQETTQMLFILQGRLQTLQELQKQHDGNTELIAGE